MDVFEKSKVKYIEDDVDGRKVIFVEQNPVTGSKYADMANDGHDVMWAIEKDSHRYVGRIIDGEFCELVSMV